MKDKTFNKASALKSSIKYIDDKLSLLRLEHADTTGNKILDIAFLYKPGSSTRVCISRYQGDQPELNAIVSRVEAAAIKELEAIKAEYLSEFEKL